MAIFEWDNSLSIGIEEIDNQHKELIKRLDELAQSILQKKGKDKIGKMLRFMSIPEKFTSPQRRIIWPNITILIWVFTKNNMKNSKTPQIS